MIRFQYVIQKSTLSYYDIKKKTENGYKATRINYYKIDNNLILEIQLELLQESLSYSNWYHRV